MSQDVARNVEKNVAKEASKGTYGSQFSREIKSMGFGIIWSECDPQISPSLAVRPHAVHVSSQFLLL